MGNTYSQEGDLVDMGVQYQIPLTIPADNVWAAMKQKIYHPEKFLPVNDVKTVDIVVDRHVFREMNFVGFVLKEDVYLDPANYKVRYEVIGDDAVHVNIFHPDTGVIEYYQENKKGDRITWPVPKTFVFGAVTQTKEIAESLM